MVRGTVTSCCSTCRCLCFVSVPFPSVNPTVFRQNPVLASVLYGYMHVLHAAAGLGLGVQKKCSIEAPDSKHSSQANEKQYFCALPALGCSCYMTGLRVSTALSFKGLSD